MSLKGRRESAGFVLIASEFSQLLPWIADTDTRLVDNAMRTWPGPVTWLFPRGPVTWLFPRAPEVPDYVAGDHATVAVRITAHEPSRALCEAFGSALISSSANHTSARPARSVGEVEEYFGHHLGGILAGPLGSDTTSAVYWPAPWAGRKTPAKFATLSAVRS
jgi:L-threonylcarbamoyladenylate synthase